ncbi:restriction endonuclease subunit S [Ralstonia insidiosa]|uniref:Restriction endonuclease subunit S n=1 Tax=Ralstonia insidiosa TaxID=190721 RepID=A0A848P3Q8_9RALS|nr:restriction endonuclease subunit S [Ralstonia insidiosa]NMV41932.1 restriction endonuclease subunit S [Ralstonia insidiosa]
MELKPGYKRTEVGVIPEQWTVKCIGDIASVSSGGTPSRQNARYWDGDIPWVTTSQVDFCVIDEAEQFISESGLKNSAAKLFAPGTLLMALYGQGKTRGKTAILGISAATNQACASIELNRQVEKSYVFHFLASKYEDIRGLSNSGGQENLSGNIVRNILIALPQQSEQQAIATALSDVDALISSLDQLIAKKRDIKQATMQQLLTGKQRLQGFSRAWERKLFRDIATIQRGASPRPIDSPIWFDDNSNVGWVRISDVTRSGMYLEKTSQQLSPEGVKHSRPVASGNLIMSICATVGRPIITRIDVCIHDGFVVFDQLQADRSFIYYVLKSIEPTWSKHGQTGSQMNLNTGLINSTSIELPPLDEQAAIASVLSDMDTEIAALEQKRDKTRALKQGMMQELLTGRIRLV